MYYRGVLLGNSRYMLLDSGSSGAGQGNVLTVSGWSQQEAVLLYYAAAYSNFTYDADFRILSKCAGFIFNAQDRDNLYMHQLVALDASGGKSSFVCWHKRVNGSWLIKSSSLPVAIYPHKWYHARFVVQDAHFELYLGEADEASLRLVASWEDPQRSFKGGYIGFRQWGPEQAQFRNAVIREKKIN